MPGLNRYSLLFLEDNVVFAKNTINFFELLFRDIFHATSIQDALNLFQKHTVHLIISDIKVDDGNGLEFIQAIRNIDREIPIIVLSAHKDENFLFKAIPLGLCDYLLKPITHDALMDSLKKANDLMDKLYCTIRHIKGELYYDSDKHVLIEGKDEFSLTEKESALLELFLKHTSSTVTKEMIAHFVYGEEGMSDAALKNLLLRLRKKIGQDLIKTIPSVGYRLSLAQT